MEDDFDEVADGFADALADMLRDSMSLLIDVEPNVQVFIDQYVDIALNDGFEFFDYVEDGADTREKRALACVFAIQIWNSTPLPSNHYRPKPLPKIQRNDPCFCGSGKKYKSCCIHSVTSQVPAMDAGIMTHHLLEVITQKELKRVWQYLPHEQLGLIANQWCSEGKPWAERALLMLDPIFKQADTKLDAKDEAAFDAMVEACSVLWRPRKKSTLIKRMMAHPDKVLQSSALQRQCCILADQDEADEAWVYFQKAQRVDPDSVSLSHLEMSLLMHQGKAEQLKQRGSYWVKRLSRMNDNGELDDLIALIQVMAETNLDEMIHLMTEANPEMR